MQQIPERRSVYWGLTKRVGGSQWPGAYFVAYDAGRGARHLAPS